MVAFGGLPVKNGQIGQGGVVVISELMNEAASAGSSLSIHRRADTISALNAEWLRVAHRLTLR